MYNHSLPLLENLLESKVTYISGGHAIWPHKGLLISTADAGRGKVQRLWYTKRHGAIPPHMFLLNTCGVPNCIEPSCHYVSKVARLSDIIQDRSCVSAEQAGCLPGVAFARCWPVTLEHSSRTPDGSACALLCPPEARCHAVR